MVTKWIGQKCFSVIHKTNLIYNTCWEDPRLDREALALGSDDTVLVITSAGCNALDYATQAPKHVYAVDMNPLQNALLELKLAAIRTLEFGDFFKVFGCGCHPDWRSIYFDAVRPELRPEAQPVWDKRLNFFDGTARRKSFYFRGTAGLFAWMINGYLKRPPGLREAVQDILHCDSVERQQEIYDGREVSKLLFTKKLRWLLRRDATLAMLGVPRSQRKQLDTCYPGGIGKFIQDRIEEVFKTLPLKDNYFWRVYLTGEYTRDCCPAYLEEANFQALKGGLVDHVSTHTNTVEGFLSNHDGKVSRFVLLDHMDWLYEKYPDLLASEWQTIIDHAAAQSRVLWRSAALDVDFVDPLPVVTGGKQTRVGDLLRYDTELASKLHARDRVNTYGSFYIADIAGVAA